MKFTMFKKETSDKKYHENPYRAVNFKRDGTGNLICPNGKIFTLKANNVSIKINMAEPKKSMNANHAKTANIKTNVVLRRSKTEPFE